MSDVPTGAVAEVLAAMQQQQADTEQQVPVIEEDSGVITITVPD